MDIHSYFNGLGGKTRYDYDSRGRVIWAAMEISDSGIP